MNKTVQQEKDYFLEQLLEKRFFEPWKNNNPLEEPKKRVSLLELQITYDCNLKCEYCYVNKYGDQLYPHQLRNRTTILKNLGVFLDYLISKQPISLPQIGLFSGEIWGEPFGYEVLEVIYQKLCIYPLTKKIMIPTNCSFLLDKHWENKMQEYIDKYKEIGISLQISASIDGAIVEEETRSFKDEQKNILRDQKFYDTVFDFTHRNKSGHHPMVAAYRIEDWKDNYDWWYKMSQTHEFNIMDTMMLEVRNDDWTDEKLLAYKEYLIHHFYQLKNHFNDIGSFVDYIFKIPHKHRKFCNLSLNHYEATSRCSIQRALMVRVGDLMITPCHRLSYPQFNYGQFKVENDKIIGVSGYNTELAAKILLANPEIASYGCDACPYNSFCIMGCYGSQYENTGELFNNCETPCKLLKLKINTLIDLFKENGIFDYYKTLELDYYAALKRDLIFDTINKIEQYRKQVIGECAND